jgi:hypothetical protein
MTNWNTLEIEGKTVKAVDSDDVDENIWITMEDGSKYHIYHEQDCCESVSIYFNDTHNLVGKKIIYFSECSEDAPDEEVIDQSTTITTYTFKTEDGQTSKVIWKGGSNGYYSEVPTIKKIK